MQKPPCPKCQGKNVYLEVPRFQPDQCYLRCYTCGWCIYGEPAIEKFVVEYNGTLAAEAKKQAEEAARQRKEAELARRRERDRANRERKRIAAEKARAATKKADEERKKVHIIPALGVHFEVGQVDPTLLLAWAQPEPNKPGESLDPCAWPPCTKRARSNSKYCSRRCTVRVAHRRDKLRKKGKLPSTKKNTARMAE